MTSIRPITLAPILLLAVLISGCAGTDANALPLTDLDGGEIVADLLSTDTFVEINADSIATIEEAVTPYQQELARTLEERAAAGLPTPSSVTFEYELVPPQEMATVDGDSTEHVVQIIAKTVLHFDGPEEAGYDVWPALVVTGTLPAGAYSSVLAGDYTDLYRTMLAEQIPGIWDQVEFGQEPRTHTVSETLNVSYSGEESPVPIRLDAAGADAIQTILMGLTYTGPQIDYTIGDTLTVRDFTIYDYEAGFKLDWTLGLRLPAEVYLSAPDQAGDGPTGLFSTMLVPLDWSAQDYVDAGVAAEDGNEFVLRLNSFVGIKAILLEINVCPICYFEASVDESASFTTPFGQDAYLPVPQIAVPIWDGSLGFVAADVGLIVSPQIGSTKITASWIAGSGSDCVESGQVTYVAPATPITFGPETLCRPAPGSDGAMELTEFRYWLDQFRLGLDVTLDTRVFGYDLWSGTPLPIEVNLSPLSQFLSLDAHRECKWRLQCTSTGAYDSVSLSLQNEEEK